MGFLTNRASRLAFEVLGVHLMFYCIICESIFAHYSERPLNLFTVSAISLLALTNPSNAFLALPRLDTLPCNSNTIFPVLGLL